MPITPRFNDKNEKYDEHVKRTSKVKAEMWDKIQTPLMALLSLDEGKEVPKKLIKMAAKDIGKIKQLIDDL